MRRASGLLLAVALGAISCTDSETKVVSLSIETTEPSPGRVAMAVPPTVTGGVVQVTLRNSGDQAHDAQLVRVEGEHAVEEVVDIVSSEGAPVPVWFHAEGGVTSVPPGASHSATMTLVPGQYYVIDTGADAAGNPFAQVGGVKPLTVSEARPGGTLPKGDVTITATEYAFEVPPDLQAGTTTVRFDNRGLELHVLLAMPISTGANLDDVRRTLTAEGSTGPPPVDLAKATGTQVIDGGRSLVTRMTFSEGSYAFVCFVSDRIGGPPHFVLGMLREVRIG